MPTCIGPVIEEMLDPQLFGSLLAGGGIFGVFAFVVVRLQSGDAPLERAVKVAENREAKMSKELEIIKAENRALQATIDELQSLMRVTKTKLEILEARALWEREQHRDS